MKQEKRKFQDETGITLIALVVTIVILIILATISVNLVINGGLISKTQEAANMHLLQEEKERLEMIKIEVASNQNNLGKVTVDSLIEELIKQGITVAEEVIDNGDGSKTVITDKGYSITLEPNGEDDVTIVLDGKAGALPPRIKKVNINIGTNEININVEAVRTEGAKYKYEYKTETGTWTEITGTGNVATITGTNEDENYTIRVSVTNAYGTVTKEVKTANIGEEESIANAPKLSAGMTPVKWNGANWEKTTASDSSWYNYGSSEKKWANVVLGDSTFKTVEGKEVLDEEANYSMLVWIPRYAYRIKSMYHENGDSTTAGKVSVVFINTQNTNTVTGTKYTRDSASQYPVATVGGAMSDYVVHPAFDFGSSKLPGFWVGKFESSNTDKTTYNGTDKTMMIKANVRSWRSIQISNMFDVCLEMNKANNVYKLPTSDSIVDPHQMKNNEWGAVAYLSKSMYGKQNEEVYINNNSSYITGIAGDTASASSSSATANTYNTVAGQKASTNGNITGVYDMSGGAWEYTAAYVNNGNGNLTSYGASLVNNTNGRYKNVYSKGSSEGQANNYAMSTPTNGHYGDAVYETSKNGSDVNGWYADYSHFPFSGSPFFVRGGGCGNATNTGLLCFDPDTGSSYSGIGFRVVVTVL